MEILFLGTGNAFASGGRNPMAILVRGRDTGVLLDCGPVTLVALAQHELSPRVVDVVLISHHHGDHFGGVPFLLLHEHYLGPRGKPLTLAGPPGTERTLRAATRLFFPGLEPLRFRADYRDLSSGSEELVGALRVTPFEVDHYSQGVAFGYRVSLEGKTIVFSGDTAWTDELVYRSKGADLFICECSSFEQPLERHMTHRDLERHRARLGAKRVLLVHAGEDVLARENELAFELAHDGMRMKL